MRLSSLTWALSLLASTRALPQISRTGKYLYDPTGARFFIKGVAYQPEGVLAVDSVANQDKWVLCAGLARKGTAY
ncbi:hypothetical protein P7C73_g6692, partial [Tremellales sp. Uapishka_1]